MITVLVDPRFEATSGPWTGFRALVVDPATDDMDDALEQLLEGGGTVLVHGDDWTVASLLTAHHQRPDLHPGPLTIGVVDVGENCTFARNAGAGGPGAVARAVASKRRKRRSASTLAVIDTAGGERVGFNFGLGACLALFSEGTLGGPSLAALGRQAEAVAADVSIDYGERMHESPGYLVASSLGSSWFAVQMDPRVPSVRVGQSLAELLPSVGRVGRLRPSKRNRASQPFRRIHIDTKAGYVLDGQCWQSDRPRVIEVRPGPLVHFVV